MSDLAVHKTEESAFSVWRTKLTNEKHVLAEVYGGVQAGGSVGGTAVVRAKYHLSNYEMAWYLVL